ncbi:hypothetical protein AK812_SmicGene32921 [Symbiodinium microadriaticum]|uniref:Uncharacterized protein n=1 Tax=Symbiodinium microadriaticum TaxID=2951 RepID=A0A1Q9CSW3_SYMMI|nr:hypothetical protein AK812_SmicGene32921 [Symbiodinium microadriaticum]
MVRLDGLRWRRLLCCCRCFLLVWWLLQRPWRVLFCVLAWRWPLRLRDTVRGRGCEKVLVGIVRSGGGLLISAGGAGLRGYAHFSKSGAQVVVNLEVNCPGCGMCFADECRAQEQLFSGAFLIFTLLVKTYSPYANVGHSAEDVS